jgi:hypothetical protein
MRLAAESLPRDRGGSRDAKLKTSNRTNWTAPSTNTTVSREAGDVDDMEEYIESFGETYLLGASRSSCSMGDFRPCYVFTDDIFLCRLL